MEFPIGGGTRLALHVEARSPCPVHAPRTCGCGAPPRRIEWVYDTPDDLWTDNEAALLNANVLAQAGSIIDTSGTWNAVAANAAASSPLIVAGTGTVAAVVTDSALGAIVAGSSGTVEAVVHPPVSYGVIGTVEVGGTIANSSGVTQNYTEVGMETTVGGAQYLLARDVFGTLPVSNGGQLAVAYGCSNG